MAEVSELAKSESFHLSFFIIGDISLPSFSVGFISESTKVSDVRDTCLLLSVTPLTDFETDLALLSRHQEVS